MKRQLIATKALRYNTRRLVAGDEFDAVDMHARLLVGIRKARYAPDKPPPAQVKQVVEPGSQEQSGDINRLRAEAQRLGVEVDRRWGDIRLKHEIAQARAR